MRILRTLQKIIVLLSCIAYVRVLAYTFKYDFKLSKWKGMTHLCVIFTSKYHECIVDTKLIEVRQNRAVDSVEFQLPTCGPYIIQYSPVASQCINADGSSGCLSEVSPPDKPKYFCYIDSKLCSSHSAASVCGNISTTACVLPSTTPPSRGQPSRNEKPPIVERVKKREQAWVRPVWITGVFAVVVSVIVIAAFVIRSRCGERRDGCRPRVPANDHIRLEDLQKIPGGDEYYVPARPPLEHEDPWKRSSGGNWAEAVPSHEAPCSSRDVETDTVTFQEDAGSYPAMSAHEVPCSSRGVEGDEAPRHFTARKKGPEKKETYKDDGTELRYDDSDKRCSANADPLIVAEEALPGNDQIVGAEVAPENPPVAAQDQPLDAAAQDQIPVNVAVMVSEEANEGNPLLGFRPADV